MEDDTTRKTTESEKARIRQWFASRGSAPEQYQKAKLMISLVEEHGFQITAVCEYLKVSRTAYYRSIRARKAERDVEKRGRPPALSLQRRNELADEITKRHQNGLTMTTAQVILEASKLATEQAQAYSEIPNTIHLSRAWIYGFMRKCPALKIAKTKPINALRWKNATDVTIRAWFKDLLEPLYAQHDYQRHMVANCDETMVQLSSKGRTTIVVPREEGYNNIPIPHETQHITFLVTAFADGSAPNTLIIFPSVNLPDELSPETLLRKRKFDVTGQRKGWITKVAFEQYCINTIIPHFLSQRTYYNSPNARGLLVVDGHSSRWNPELMKTFEDHHIDVVTLVAHTSHIVQPLDALVFSSFKAHLSKGLQIALSTYLAERSERAPIEPTSDSSESESDEFDFNDDVGESTDLESAEERPKRSKLAMGLDSLSAPEKRYCLIRTAMHALELSLATNNVEQSFRTTGIYPLSVERALSRKGVRAESLQH